MRRGIRSELLGLLLLSAFVPLTLSLGIAWWQGREALEREVTSGLLAIATRQAEAVNDSVRELELHVERVARSGIVVRAMQEPTAAGGDAGKLREDLNALAGALMARSDSENLFLIDRDGRIAFAANETQPPLVGRAASAVDPLLGRVVERAGKILETELSDLEYRADRGGGVAYAVTPVFGDGLLLGVLAIQVDPARLLAGSGNHTGLGASGETIVATQRGEEALVVAPLRADPDAAFRLSVPLGAGGRTPLAESVRGRRGSGVATDYRGTEVFAVWRYVPALRLGIVVKIDREEAFASVHRLGRLFALLFLSTVVLVPMLAWHQARRLTRPLLALRSVTGRVAAGDFGVDVAVDSGNEIADLAASFREMTTRLRQSFDELRRTTAEREAAAAEAIAAREEVERVNRGLEETVAARTAELRHRNGELENALAELRATQQQLIVREKMASLGELTSGVAHEISNPLNFVNNFAELSIELLADLKKLPPGGETGPDAIDNDERGELIRTLEENLAKIHEHGRRAQRIVQGMIELTRVSSTEVRPTDLNPFVQELARAAMRALHSLEGGAQVALHFDLAEDLPPVPVAGSGLSRALHNVLSNAVWATRERAASGGPGFAPEIRIATRAAEGEVAVIVRDNGIGIGKENMGRIFQPFFTTRPTGRGSTGLGLSMAWEVVVTQHGGRLECESVRGEYTEFRMILPAPAAAAEDRR
jgi:signal transduction histidine kinase